MSEQRTTTFFPLFLSIAIAIGFYLGTTFGGEAVPSEDKETLLKYNSILQYIEDNYVDEVNRNQLVEESIASMLLELDPHSVYIPARHTDVYNESLQGHFGGVGIRFRIYRDTLMIVNVIEGGPSDRSGLLAGDRVIGVDGENIAGEGLTNEDVLDKLKGTPGTPVEIKILRDGEVKDIPVTRGVIPIKSVDTYYMIEDKIGYLYLNRFSETTSKEFRRAVSELNSQGMQKLILDLRGNSGGYLDQAVQLADEILGNGALIVYTQGRKRERVEYRAKRPGMLEHTEICVLVDEGSASASEILAGAIQDNDRGYVVGRRSFGKGLVQERKILEDNSELRLTIARYYTPAGRSIQRPYGEEVDYRQDFSNRIENGELYAPDSALMADSLVYYTLNKKRKVYGGGGIMPDIFVAYDTLDLNYSAKALRYLYDEFGYFYLDAYRKQLLSTYPDFKSFGENYTVSDQLVKTLVDTAQNRAYNLLGAEVEIAKNRIKAELKENLADHLYGFDGSTFVRNSYDNTVLKALELLKAEKLAELH